MICTEICLLAFVILSIKMNVQSSVNILVSHHLLYDVISNHKNDMNHNKMYKDLFEATMKQNKIHVEYTDHIKCQISVKVSRFLVKYKAGCKGEVQKTEISKMAQCIDNWQFKVLYSDYREDKILTENAKLKTKLNNAIKTKQALNKKLQRKDKVIKRQKLLLVKLSRKRVNRLRRRNVRVKNGEYSRSQIFRRKQELKHDCTSALAFLENQGLEY